jgi:hypothetical protein
VEVVQTVQEVLDFLVDRVVVQENNLYLQDLAILHQHHHHKEILAELHQMQLRHIHRVVEEVPVDLAEMAEVV